MKIKLSENTLRQLIAESVKEVLNEIDALDAVAYGRQAYSQGTPSNPNWSADNKEYNERKRRQGDNISQMAVNRMNAQGSGNCIQKAAPWQINFKSASGYNTYITSSGVIGIVGKQKHYDHLAIPNELKVKAEDAKLIADWCKRYVKNEYALQKLSNPQFWIIK